MNFSQADNFVECHPWKEYACCNQSTVATVDTINQGYGAEYRCEEGLGGCGDSRPTGLTRIPSPLPRSWDRCGPLSQACERFFVQVGF